MHFPDGLDAFLGAKGLGDVDDDEVRFSCAVSDPRQRQRGFHDNGITCFAQPTLEQAKNQVVRFDNKDTLPLLHPRISNYQSVTNV